jgi:hypothetical protein
MPAFQFNAQGIDPQYGGGGGLPFGRHPVVISASALKPTKDGQGGYMELTLTAIDGPAKGLFDYDRLNLHNKSAQAVEIANKQLAAYCAVVGVFAFQATEELHNKPFVVEIGPRKDNPQQGEVKALFDMNGNEPGKAGGGAPQTFGAPATGQPATGAGPAPADTGGQPAWGGGAAPATSGGAWAQGGGGQPATGQPGWGQR